MRGREGFHVIRSVLSFTPSCFCCRGVNCVFL
ncbi:hypothetical protein OIU76_023574, partial [Salix suchowensis]